MGFVRKLLGTLFISAVLTATLSYAVNGRLLNFKYLQQKANTDQIYAQIAKSLPQALDSPNDSQNTAAVLDTIITPQYVQTKLGGFLDQMQAFYHDKGPAPTLDLRDLAVQARLAGLDVPPDNPLEKPIVYQDPGLKAQMQQAQQVQLYAPLAAVILLILIMITLPAPARYRSAAKTILAAALSLGVLYGLFRLLPGILESVIKSNKDIAALAPTLISVIRAVTGDMAQDILTIAIGLVALAGGFFLLGMTGGFGRFLSKSGGQELKPLKRATPDKRLKVHD